MNTDVKYKVIEHFKDNYKIYHMCCFLGVSRSGYYAYLKRKNNVDPDEYLGMMIQKCQEETDYTYGYRRVKIWLLQKTGLVINHKAILRIMRKYDLLARIRRVRKYHRYGEYLQKSPNRLERNFSAARPNQKWVTDISFIKTQQGILYLSVIKDLCDGAIVSYHTSLRNDNTLVLQTLKKASKEICADLILHSDQGFQYGSTAYLALTKEYGILPSMSRAGTPLDNAPAESFFATLKTECLYRHKNTSVQQTRSLIDQYIYFYNYQRIQLKTKLTPFEKRRQLS